MYLAIAIGNSDDKLKQRVWSHFVVEVEELIKKYGVIHFFGGAPNWEMWQNAAWIVEMRGDFEAFKVALKDIRQRYDQDSAFLLFGDGQFI